MPPRLGLHNIRQKFTPTSLKTFCIPKQGSFQVEPEDQVRSAPYLPREKTSILGVTPLESSSLEPNKGSQLSSRSGLVSLCTSTSLQQGPVIGVGGEELDMDTGLGCVAWFSVLLWGVLFVFIFLVVCLQNNRK